MAEIEVKGSIVDGTPPEAFMDFARAIPGVAVGLSGDRLGLLPAVEQLRAAGKPPDALFLNVIWPCGDPGQIETPESRRALPLALASYPPTSARWLCCHKSYDLARTSLPSHALSGAARQTAVPCR